MGLLVAIILALVSNSTKVGGIDPNGGLTSNTTVSNSKVGGIDPNGGFTSSTTVNTARVGGIDPNGG